MKAYGLPDDMVKTVNMIYRNSNATFDHLIRIPNSSTFVQTRSKKTGSLSKDPLQGGTL